MEVPQVVVPKPGSVAGGGVLPFAPPDKSALHLAYMPFLKNGGVYITTSKKYDIGNEVFILVKLPNDAERFPAVGKVVWINRSGSALRPAGIGVQFMDTPENTIVRDKIEVVLAGMPVDAPTYTM